MVEAELGLTDLERPNLQYSMDKLKTDASGVMICVRQLKGLLNHFGMVEANIDKRSQELDLKEKELLILSSDLERKINIFEAEKSEAADLKKLTEECTQELRSKRNQLTAKLDSLTRIQGVLDSKDTQLGLVMAELKRRCNEARKVQDQKSEMEDETARKKTELSLIVNQIEESGKQLEKRSQEVELKEKDIEDKRKEGDLVKSQVKSWERKLIQLRKLVSDDCTAELSSRKDQVDSWNNTPHVEVELKKKQLEQTKSLLVKHNGVEEDNHVKVVMSSSDVNSIKHPPLFYTYQRKEETLEN